MGIGETVFGRHEKDSDKNPGGWGKKKGKGSKREKKTQRSV